MHQRGFTIPAAPRRGAAAPPPVAPLSRYVVEQFEELGNADSITVDPHKSGYIPYPAGALCYRNAAMRNLVTFSAPVIFHGEAEPTVGIYGIEGSKPGAAAAAVYLSHRVIRPSRSGYGKIIGQALFSCRKLYARLLAMDEPVNGFKAVPVPRQPAERNGGDVATEVQKIRNLIDRRSGEEIRSDATALELLQEIGPDLNILAYAFNFYRADGSLNDDLDATNRLNQAIYRRLSIDPGDDIYGHRLIVSTTDLDQENYGSAFIAEYKRRLGVARSAGLRITVLRSVVMDPWVTDTRAGSFIDVLEQEFRRAVMAALSEIRHSANADIDMAQRRIALYFSWSRPAEYAAPPGVELSTPLGRLEDRYPTLFEFRRAVWPAFERLSDPNRYNQSIAGFFDHVILPDFDRFRQTVRDTIGSEVAVLQRVADDGRTRSLDEGLLSSLDTLVVVSLDHSRTAQTASPAEITALKAFLKRESACVVICPHHDIGKQDSFEMQRVEFDHHGDRTIPARQRLGEFALSLLAGLGVPIVNKYGLRPAKSHDGTPASLIINPDAPGVQALLAGVTTFNMHPHLPHLEIDPTAIDKVDVLARQLIDPTAPPHPFVEAGNTQFNALLRARPDDLRGSVLVGDATLWSSAFGGVGSLSRFWSNLARLPT